MSQSIPLLKWEEPLFTRKSEARELRKVSAGLFTGIFIVLLLVQWAVPHRDWNFSVDLLMGLLLVAMYSLIQIIIIVNFRLAKPQVSLNEESITYVYFWGNGTLRYDEIQSFCLLKTNLDENEFFVLKLQNRNGSENSIDIEPQINSDSIIEIFKRKNVQMKTVSDLF